MNDKTTSQTKLDSLLETKDYTKIRVFLKQSRYCKKPKDSNFFWESHLPITWFQNLSKEPFFKDLLRSYFRRRSTSNTNFLKLFFNSPQKKTLISVIKLSQAFENKNHWDSFSVFQKDSQLKVFYKELQFIKDYRNYWKAKAVRHEAFIKTLSYEDIMFHTVMCYQDFKEHSIKAAGNWSLKVSLEAILIDVLNTLLQLKKESLGKRDVKPINKYDSTYFKTISNVDYQLLNKPFKNSLEFYIAKYDNEYQINKYLSGFAEFDFIDGLSAGLSTNDKHTKYRKTLSKGTYDETYFTNRVIDNKSHLKNLKAIQSLWEKQFQLAVLSSVEYFNFLDLPTTIHLDKNAAAIDLKKVMFLLKTFSLLLISQESQKFGNQYITQEVPESFKKFFYSDYVVCYDENEFLDKCSKYFNWSIEETLQILDFITTNLNTNTIKTIDIKSNPLIKVGTQYFWLSSFMKDRRWEITLHKKLVSEGLLNHNQQATNQENYIETIFKASGFNALSEHRYKHDNKSGEIDTLVYKDGVLFICELKSTYIIEDMLHTSKYEAETFNKASEQLDLAKAYIQDNFDAIKSLKELKIDRQLEDIKIETVIISNSYQADNTIINEKHLKLSLFELLIILKNDLHNMLISKLGSLYFDERLNLPIDQILNAFNRNNIDTKLNTNSISEASCNLWENEMSCSPNDIISAIKYDKVWKHQDDNRHFGLEEIEISTINEAYKYLN